MAYEYSLFLSYTISTEGRDRRSARKCRVDCCDIFRRQALEGWRKGRLYSNTRWICVRYRIRQWHDSTGPINRFGCILVFCFCWSSRYWSWATWWCKIGVRALFLQETREMRCPIIWIYCCVTFSLRSSHSVYHSILQCLMFNYINFDWCFLHFGIIVHPLSRLSVIRTAIMCRQDGNGIHAISQSVSPYVGSWASDRIL